MKLKRLFPGIILCFFLYCCTDRKQVSQTAAIIVPLQQDSTFLLGKVPSILIKDTSTAYLYISGGDIFYEVDYTTGKKTSSFSLEKSLSKDDLCATFFEIDTSLQQYKRLWLLREKYGYKPYSLMALDHVNDSMLAIACILHIPKMINKNGDSVLTEILQPLIVTKHKYKSDNQTVRPLDLHWTEILDSNFSPDFGFHINKGKILIGALSQHYANTSIYVEYDLGSLKRLRTSPIRHHPTQKVTDVPSLTFYHFINYNGKTFVDNATQVYNTNNNELIHDFKAEIPDMEQIYFFYPLDTALNRWFVYYRDNKHSEKSVFSPPMEVIINTKLKKIEASRNGQVGYFSYYNNKIISIEKDSQTVYFKHHHF